MNTKVVKKFLYAPTLFTALALIGTSECLAIGEEGRTEQLTRRVTVVRETQKIKDGPVMAEYQIAVAKGEMALTTMIVNVAACAQRQDRDDDYLNIYWKDGRGFEWKPGASEGICYMCDETQMANYLVFWINRGGLYNSQPSHRLFSKSRKKSGWNGSLTLSVDRGDKKKHQTNRI